MPISIGLTGAHRTGKTTLAKTFAENADFVFVQTSTSAVMKSLGFDPKEDVPLKDRLWVQNHILTALEESYKEQTGSFITDRTPLDAAAYMLADVQRENAVGLEKDLQDYVQRCFDITNRSFGFIVQVQPGIKVVEEQGKAPGNPAYVDHIHYLICGLIRSPLMEVAYSQMPSGMTDLHDRLRWLGAAINFTIDKTVESRNEFSKAGRLVH